MAIWDDKGDLKGQGPAPGAAKMVEKGPAQPGFNVGADVMADAGYAVPTGTEAQLDPAKSVQGSVSTNSRMGQQRNMTKLPGEESPSWKNLPSRTVGPEAIKSRWNESFQLDPTQQKFADVAKKSQAAVASPTVPGGTRETPGAPLAYKGTTDFGVQQKATALDPSRGLGDIAAKAGPETKTGAGEGEAVMWADGKETRIKNAADRPKGLMDTAYFQKNYNSPLGNSKTNNKDAFNGWAKKVSEAMGGDILDQQTHYDLQGAFMAGVKPEDIKQNGLPDKFMKPNHPNVGPSSQHYDKQLAQMLNPDERGLPEGAKAFVPEGKTMKEITAKAKEPSPEWQEAGKNEAGFTRWKNPTGGWSGPPKDPRSEAMDMMREQIDSSNTRLEQLDNEIKRMRPGDAYTWDVDKLASLQNQYNELMGMRTGMTDKLAALEQTAPRIAAETEKERAEAEEKRARAGYWSTAGRDIKEAQAQKARAEAKWTEAGRPTQGKQGKDTASKDYDSYMNNARNRLKYSMDQRAMDELNLPPDEFELKQAAKNPNWFIDEKNRIIYDKKTNRPIRQYPPLEEMPVAPGK